MNVGEKIKKYRLEQGMTQEELGKELGVGKAAVQKYESGQVQNLKSAHIKKLCALFNRRPWDFIFDDEDEIIKKDVILTIDEINLLREKFGNETIEFLEPLSFINEIGLNKIREYISDISKIEEYKK